MYQYASTQLQLQPEPVVSRVYSDVLDGFVLRVFRCRIVMRELHRREWQCRRGGEDGGVGGGDEGIEGVRNVGKDVEIGGGVVLERRSLWCVFERSLVRVLARVLQPVRE